MSIQNNIQAEVIASMKAGDTQKRDALRMIASAIKNEVINKGELTEEQEIEILARELKRLKDSLQEFETAGRAELIEKTKKEIEYVLAFMPAQASDEEIIAKAKEMMAAGVGEVNKLMGPLMKEFKGKADGTRVREIIMKLVQG